MTERGCGSRQEGGLYVCVPTSPFGKPIEYFLLDPVIPFTMPSDVNLRAPYLHRDPEGTFHLVLGVGNTYYPFVSDYVEETKVMGISKRLPRNFDYRQLDPSKSNLILIHKRAIPDFSYHINREDYYNCPRLISGRYEGDALKFPPEHLVKVKRGDQTIKMVAHPCLGDTWALGSCLNVPEKHELTEGSDGMITVKTPSATYSIDPAFTMKDGQRLTELGGYQVGAFLRFPKFHFEYVRRTEEWKAGDVYTDEETGEKRTLTEDDAKKINSTYESSLEKLQEIYVDRGFGFKVMEE